MAEKQIVQLLLDVPSIVSWTAIPPRMKTGLEEWVPDSSKKSRYTLCVTRLKRKGAGVDSHTRIHPCRPSWSAGVSQMVPAMQHHGDNDLASRFHRPS